MQKDYEVKESVYVIYKVLTALKHEYYYELIDELGEKTEEYLKYLRDIIEKDYEPNDIKDNKLIDRIIFEVNEGN